MSLISRALLPNIKSKDSIRLDLPEPLGPTTLVNRLWNGPMVYSKKREWVVSFFTVFAGVGLKVLENNFGDYETFGLFFEDCWKK